MSFGQPPPKTPYGDQDFIKEDFTSQQPNQGLYGNRNPQAYTNPNQQTPYGQTMTPASGPNSPYPVNQQGVVAPMPPSLTPEDQLFIRSWRNDSLIYRVMPIGLGASSALFYYNRSKGLPHKISRYVGIAVLSVVVGNWSYRSELRRRLEVSPLNTPFMKALREIAGVKPTFASMDEFSTEDSTLSAGWNANEPAYGRPYVAPAPGGGYASGLHNQMPPTAYGQYNQDSRGPPNQGYETDMPPPPGAFGGEPGKSTTSYEELRARNRGLLQK